ncbi:RNI-like protein [Lichtheimia hyalospora FSU 10163]|nr:RNI-like protein [Lichtheimia hyalospora FSU 10163]
MNQGQRDQNQGPRRNRTAQFNARARNRVRGPTTALTSFLREQGIHVVNRNIRSRQRRAQEQREAAAATAAAATTTNSNDATTTTTGDDATGDNSEASSTTTISSPQGNTSILYMPGRRGRRSEAAQNIIAQAEASSSSSKKKTPKKRKKDDDDYQDSSGSETDDGTFIPTSRPPRTKIVFCEKCKSRFSRSMTQNLDIQLENLCPNCRGEPSSSKSKPPRKQRNLNRSGKKDGQKVSSLQDICINVLVKYIDHVEEFGEIGIDNLDKIAKIICRNRKLNNQTLRLLLNPRMTKLALYDCSNVDNDGFANVAHFCYDLMELRLTYCGQLTSEVLQMYAERMKKLQSIDLSGPYMVYEAEWIRFFKTIGKRLKKFILHHSFRFTKDCMTTLADQCPDLESLAFSDTPMLNDDWLEVIGRFEKLEKLRLAWPDDKQHISSESLITLITKIGPNLTELALPGCTQVDDDVLIKAIMEHCPKLKVLDLAHCHLISSEGVQTLFTEWASRYPKGGLEHLNLSRCLELDDKALESILAYAAGTLKTLNLHSLDLLSSSGLEMIAGDFKQDDQDKKNKSANRKKSTDKKPAIACKQLKQLDCSFVRSMDDYVLKKLSVACSALQELNVWGCYQLTDQILLPPTLRVCGREMAS